MKQIIFASIILAIISWSLDGQTIRGNERTTISLPTLQCGSCVKKVEKALKKVDGVLEVSVSLDSKQAEVTFDNTVTNVKELEKAITSAGYDANAEKRDEKAFNKLPGCCRGE